jgi:hypothetical protein
MNRQTREDIPYFNLTIEISAIRRGERRPRNPFDNTRVDEIINARCEMIPITTLRLSRFFAVSPDFWMNLQLG